MSFDPDKFLSEKDDSSSAFDPDAFLGAENDLPEVEEKSLSDNVLDGVIAAGRFVDSYTGAPTRKAIDSAIDGENPISAFSDQFGEDPDNAPTGKSIAEKIGITSDSFKKIAPSVFEKSKGSDAAWGGFLTAVNPVLGLASDKIRDFVGDTSPSGVVGLGIDVAADPTNLIGLGEAKALAKGAGKIVGKGAIEGVDLAARGTAKGLDLLTGSTKASSALNMLKDVGKTAASTASDVSSAIAKGMKPAQVDDWDMIKDIAMKNGIDPADLPEAVEFGPNSFISRASRAKAEGPFGTQLLERNQKVKNSLESALDDKIVGYVQKGGVAPDPVVAGQQLRADFDEAAENILSNTTFTYKSVADQVPNMKITAPAKAKITKRLNEMENKAADLIRNGVTKTDRVRGEQILKAVEVIKGAGGEFQDLTNSLQSIGRVAFKSENSLADITPDIAEFKKLYHTISESLIDTTRTNLGDDIADELITNNKTLSEFFSDKSQIAGIMGSKQVPPEKVFQNLIMNGNSQQLEALSRLLGPEKMKQYKGAILAEIAKRNLDDGISFGRLRTSLKDHKRANQLSHFFDSDELQEISEIVELGDRLGSSVLSSSGTGASNSFRNLSQNLVDNTFSDQIVDFMKRKARNVTPPPPIPLAVQQAPKDGALSLLAGRPIANSNLAKIKTAGVIASTINANREPDDRLVEHVDANPGAALMIKNPQLRKQVIDKVNERRKERKEAEIDFFLNPKVREATNQKDFIEGN